MKLLIITQKVDIDDDNLGFFHRWLEKFSEKLRILLNNKNLAMEMGKKGRAFVQNKFSNENYINNYLKMINV